MRNFLFILCAFFLISTNAMAFLKPNITDKEITISIESTKEEVKANINSFVFTFHADYTDDEFKIWEKNLRNDIYVKSITSHKIDGVWKVTLILNTSLNRTVAKELFSFSIKATYIIIENEKILFNVFISKYIPQ